LNLLRSSRRSSFAAAALGLRDASSHRRLGLVSVSANDFLLVSSVFSPY